MPKYELNSFVMQVAGRFLERIAQISDVVIIYHYRGAGLSLSIDIEGKQYQFHVFARLQEDSERVRIETRNKRFKIDSLMDLDNLDFLKSEQKLIEFIT